MSRTKTCAGCKRELTYVLHPCRKCRKNFCSPAIRDCVLVHGCDPEAAVGGPIKVELPEAR